MEEVSEVLEYKLTYCSSLVLDLLRSSLINVMQLDT